MQQRTRALTRGLTAVLTSVALSVSLGGLLLAGGAAAAPSETGTTNGAAGTKVTTSDLNLRTGPSLDAAIVKVIPKGTTVTTTGTVSGTFAQVRIDGVTNLSLIHI